MAEMEDDVIDEEVPETTEDNEETPETPEEDEITWEQAQEWKKEAQAKAKAEAKVVELKRQLKEASKQKPTEGGDFVTKEELQLERFLSKNPEMEDSVEEIKKHLAKGLNLEQAKILVENEDKTLQNRKKTNAMNITRSEGTRSIKSEYTKAELGKLSDAEYEKIVPLVKAGKVRLT